MGTTFGTSASSESRRLRKFGVTVGAAFGILGAVLTWRGASAGPFLLALAVLLVGSGLAVPRVLRPIEMVWMRVATAIGYVMTRVILVLAYYLVITPMGLLLRLLGKDLLGLRIERDRSSYWEPPEADGSSSRPDKPY